MTLPHCPRQSCAYEFDPTKGYNFCPMCATPIGWECPQCQFNVPVLDWSFCPKCATKRGVENAVVQGLERLQVAYGVKERKDSQSEGEGAVVGGEGVVQNSRNVVQTTTANDDGIRVIPTSLEKVPESDGIRVEGHGCTDESIRVEGHGYADDSIRIIPGPHDSNSSGGLPTQTQTPPPLPPRRQSAKLSPQSTQTPSPPPAKSEVTTFFDGRAQPTALFDLFFEQLFAAIDATIEPRSTGQWEGDKAAKCFTTDIDVDTLLIHYHAFNAEYNKDNNNIPILTKRGAYSFVAGDLLHDPATGHSHYSTLLSRYQITLPFEFTRSHLPAVPNPSYKQAVDNHIQLYHQTQQRLIEQNRRNQEAQLQAVRWRAQQHSTSMAYLVASTNDKQWWCHPCSKANYNDERCACGRRRDGSGWNMY